MFYFCGFSFYSLLLIPTLLKEVMFQSQMVTLNIVVFLWLIFIVCLARLDNCLELLIKTNRLPEAAFLARTYLPSQVSRSVFTFTLYNY